MKAGALILAAGGSSRLGQPKQLARLNGETLLDRAVRIAGEAGCHPVVIVLGSHEAEIRSGCDLRNTTVISHTEWQQGMGTSLACGMKIFQNEPGLIVMTCDMPAVTADHLRSLEITGETTASCYAGRKGVPVYFPNRLFSTLRRLQGDAGARELLGEAACVPLPFGEVDVDTPEDLATAQTLFH